MGLFGEVVLVIDAISALRAMDAQIVEGVRHLTELARAAITDLRSDATEEFANQRAATATLREDATAALASLRDQVVSQFVQVNGDITQARVDATAAIGALRDQTSTSLTSLQQATTEAIGADRARIGVVETAIARPTTGVLARLSAAEAKMTAHGW